MFAACLADLGAQLLHLLEHRLLLRLAAPQRQQLRHLPSILTAVGAEQSQPCVLRIVVDAAEGCYG